MVVRPQGYDEERIVVCEAGGELLGMGVTKTSPKNHTSQDAGLADQDSVPDDTAESLMKTNAEEGEQQDDTSAVRRKLDLSGDQNMPTAHKEAQAIENTEYHFSGVTACAGGTSGSTTTSRIFATKG